jgi:ribosome biogenesis protein Tsr3
MQMMVWENLAEKRCDPEAAVNHYCLHVEAAFDAWGYGDPRTLNAVEDFVAYLRALGREEEAVKVVSLTRLTDDFG